MAEPGGGTRLRVALDVSVSRRLTDAGYSVTSNAATQRTVALFDTGDRRLAAAGAELSFNGRDGWLWRRDPLGNPKLRVRAWAAPADTPQEVVDGWSRAYRRGRPLAARATVCVHRRTHQVTSGDGQHTFSLIDERVDDRRTDVWTPRLRRVTVNEADSAEAGNVRDLCGDSILEDSPTLALLRPALVRATRLQLPSAEAHGARDLFLRSVTLSLTQWLYFDCELSGSGSPDALRKLRVALRRLRSDLQTFAPLLDREWADGLRDRLGGLGGRLGTVRDAEVLSGRLAELASSLTTADQSSALPLLDTAASQLSTARAQLLDELSRDDYVDLLDSTIVALAGPRWADGAGEVPPVTVLAARPWRRLRRYVGAIRGTPDDEQMHRVRILAKRARYAADASVPAVGDAAAAASTLLADLQTALGEHHDAVVTREWLHRQAGAAADVAYVAGELAALEMGRLRGASQRWPALWKAVSRRKDWRWLTS